MKSYPSQCRVRVRIWNVPYTLLEVLKSDCLECRIPTFLPGGTYGLVHLTFLFVFRFKIVTFFHHPYLTITDGVTENPSEDQHRLPETILIIPSFRVNK